MTRPGAARMPTVAVIDIDGVVADVRHRLHHLRRHRWDLFFDAADGDPPLAIGIDLVSRLGVEHQIVWLSGRPEWLRSVTLDWLRENDLPSAEILLRADGDYRPARVMKLERVATIARVRTVAAIVDDDPDVVDTLTAAGFPAILADWVPHSKTLHRAQEREGRT